MKRSILFAAAALAGGLAICAFADLDGSYILPLDNEAIQYATRPLSDPVSKLIERVNSGQIQLEYNAETGYLPAILKALNVPVSSQVLVFSKTSFQAPRISPRNPRALYYNDQVSVGYVRTGEVVEIASVDPQQGVIFYTLDQEKSAKPQITRRGECLQCHASPGTLGIPGLVVRSVFPDNSGMPMFQAGSYVTDHRSPLKQRWGGWYVTGTHGTQVHMGNVTATSADPDALVGKGSNATDLKWRFDTGAYLSPHSDIVSLMTLEHQTRMINLIARVNYETRIALHEQAGINKALGEPDSYIGDSEKHRIENAGESLLTYMLFADETPLEGQIKGTSNFAAEFSSRGPRDHRGRSLRDFEMTHRMFKYPCSYMIYSEAFDGLPDPAKQYIYRRLWEVLTGKDTSKTYARLSAEDRQNVLEILLDTKKNLPDSWRQARHSS